MRFNLLSYNVGVLKPFETLTVIKVYANKPDSKRVDAFNAQCLHSLLCRLFSVKHVSPMIKVVWKVYF